MFTASNSEDIQERTQAITEHLINLNYQVKKIKQAEEVLANGNRATSLEDKINSLINSDRIALKLLRESYEQQIAMLTNSFK